MAAEQGVDVLQFPGGHCELNPIELLRAHVKTHVAKNNTTYRMTDAACLVHEGIQTATPDLWSRFCCANAIKVEEEYWLAYGLQANAVEEIIIRIPAGDDEESSSEDDDEEDDEEFFSD